MSTFSRELQKMPTALVQYVSEKLHLPSSITSRLPLALDDTFSGGTVPGGAPSQINAVQLMHQLPTVGWLFAVVDRISTEVAAANWRLYRKTSKGNREEVFKHPLIDLWNRPNPFYTREEFTEASQQFFELVGEYWWIILRDDVGTPAELWPVRPDRMQVVTHPTLHIQGYLYKIGSVVVPLQIRDVYLARRPHPLNPFRGIGTVQSILPDLQAEQQSSIWSRNFYKNSALPGGIIELDEELGDDAFEKFVERWRIQHQGVSNSHRVAVLERAKWKDRKMTQRDMQFEQIRKMNRDLIIGAFGVSGAVLGIAESVNRANADAGALVFSRYTINPRLRRMRGLLNQFAQQFGADLEWDYDDPTAENHELALEESVKGFEARILTLNEARRRLGEPAMPDGDKIEKPPPPPAPFSEDNPAEPPPTEDPKDSKATLELIIKGPVFDREAIEAQVAEIIREAVKAPDPAPRPDEVEEKQSDMEKAWARRLDAESEGLTSFLEGGDV